jgi:hypothetical protein
MNEREQIERTRRHQAGYKRTGFIGVYDHVLLREQVEMADTIERLLADQDDWRKGVELIANGLGESDPPNLSCVRLFEKVLKLRVRLEKLEAVLDIAKQVCDEDDSYYNVTYDLQQAITELDE